MRELFGQDNIINDIKSIYSYLVNRINNGYVYLSKTKLNAFTCSQYRITHEQSGHWVWNTQQSTAVTAYALPHTRRLPDTHSRDKSLGMSGPTTGRVSWWQGQAVSMSRPICVEQREDIELCILQLRGGKAELASCQPLPLPATELNVLWDGQTAESCPCARHIDPVKTRDRLRMSQMTGW